MTGQALVDVSYRGMELGTRLRLSEFGPETAYLEMPKPMPVGTRIEVTTDSGLSFHGRVLRVAEEVAGAERPPGMRIAAQNLDGEVKAWWVERISIADPAIPEPPKGDHAADERTETDIVEAVPVRSVDDVPTQPGRTGAKRTMIMSTDEIRAAIEAGGQHAEIGDGVPDSVDADPTDPVRAADDESRGDDGSNGDPRVRGKNKRRRKKRKTRG